METSSTLRSALRNIVSAARDKTVAELSQEQQTILEEALGREYAIESGVLCGHCKRSIPQSENVGNILAEEVQAALNTQRGLMGIVVRHVNPGAISVLERPRDVTKYRQLEIEGNWRECEATSELIYPPETYIQSTLLLRDQLSAVGHVAQFALGVQKLVEDTLGRERALFSVNTTSRGPETVRVILSRKPLTAVVCDTYNLGQPSRGWYFEGIVGVVEFLR